MLSCLTLLLPTVAQAASPRAEAPRVELIVEAKDEPLSARLVSALESQLIELGVDVVQSDQSPGGREAEGQAPIALIWIRSQGDTLAIHFFEPGGEYLRVRDVPLLGQDPVSIEEVSLIVRSYIEALLATPPTTTKALPSPSPGKQVETETPKHPGVEPQLRVEPAFIVTSFANDADWQPGARLGLGISGLGPLSLGLQATVLPTLVVEHPLASLEIARHPIGAFVGVRLPVLPALWMTPRVSAQADFIQRSTRPPGRAVPTADETRTAFALGSELLLEWQLLTAGGLFASGGAEVVLNRYDYAVTAPEGEVTVLSPQPVRPVLGVGIWLQLP